MEHSSQSSPNDEKTPIFSIPEFSDLQTSNSKNDTKSENSVSERKESSLFIEGIEFIIDNITATRKLCFDKEINLLNAALAIECAKSQIICVEFIANSFPGLIIRLRSPKVTCKVFKNGNIWLGGAKSMEDVNKGIRKIARTLVHTKDLEEPDIFNYYGFNLEKTRQNSKIPSFSNDSDGSCCLRICSIGATANVGFKLNLGTLRNHYPEECRTDTEDAGLTFVFSNKRGEKFNFKLYVSGKVNVRGAKTKEQIIEGFRILFPILKEHAILPKS